MNAWNPNALFDRKAKEVREDQILAPWAMRSRNSLGRSVPEGLDPLRTEWERDRDRLIHSTAFRRLMYKTQVFANWEGDHNRTRLSHSLEVAQVARSVGSALFLNEPLCEALALAHDIGHPPFGHRGEWTLNTLMADHGGFRHNAHVLRVVDLLERRSPDYPGLNLTREVRESLLKHETEEDWPAEFLPKPSFPCVEAQVVDLADSTAYDAHDIEDGLHAGMFHEKELEELALWRRAREAVEQRHPGFLDDSGDFALRVKRTANELIKLKINELIEGSRTRIQNAEIGSPEEARAQSEMLIGHGMELGREVNEIQEFLEHRFYQHEHLKELTRHAEELLGALFRTLLEKPQEMAAWYQSWVDEVGLERAVCDYLAGMTDRFAEREYERLMGRPPSWFTRR